MKFLCQDDGKLYWNFLAATERGASAYGKASSAVDDGPSVVLEPPVGSR